MTEQGQYLNSILHPVFIERDGAVLFANHFGDAQFERDWQELAWRDPNRVERTINHIHLGDLSENEAVQQLLGQRIQQVWFEALLRKFPEREFSIALTRSTRDGSAEWMLDLWTYRGAHNPSGNLALRKRPAPVLAPREGGVAYDAGATADNSTEKPEKRRRTTQEAPHEA